MSGAAGAVSAYKLWLVVEPEAVEFSYVTTAERPNDNAGFDLYTAEEFGATGPALVSLGVRAMMTRLDTGEGVHYWLAPRSSIYKTGYVMANSLGVIDRSYRGVLKAPVVRAAGSGALRQGERHFQIVAPDLGWIKEVEVVAELPATARGDGGFGSTGR
jgi:dUTP pyrophosphatase